MSVFPLTPGDVRQVAKWTREKNEALAFIARCEALIAETPEDNSFLGTSPVDVRHPPEEIISRFVKQIADMLADHYQCKVETWDVLKEQPRDCDAEKILELGAQQLNGQSVGEAARAQIKANLGRHTGSSWSLQGRKVTITNLLYFQESWNHEYNLPYGQLTPLVDALACWATGALYADWRLWSIIQPRSHYATADEWFRVHPTPVTAIEGLRYFKNGRVDIIFATAEQARDFVAQYGTALSA
ncbi:MAG: hypothetical protein M1272_05560 [Firmicutes bacterium]|nr:hypothetical protein [Bacillota bacterium]